MSFCTQTRDTPYSRATSLLLRPSITTAVITSRAIDMAHLRTKEGANYVPGHLLTMSCNQSPSPALCDVSGHRSYLSRVIVHIGCGHRRVVCVGCASSCGRVDGVLSGRGRPLGKISLAAFEIQSAHGFVKREAGLGPEEGQHRQHSAMVIGCRRDAQLVKDGSHVLLDRPFGNHQSVSDPLIGASLRHQREHLPLARG